jgi:hypothetical protein
MKENMNTEISKSGPGWMAEATINGIRDVYCESWMGFVDFLNGTLSEFDKYVYRGHASSKWKLESSLDRLTSTLKNKQNIANRRLAHLSNFKMASRGRRNYPVDLTDDEWWALGQHNGLATPLLDWTESPYVAAYFALAADPKVLSDQCVVYGLSSIFVDKTNAKEVDINNITWGELKLFKPKNDENARLVSQRGLFSITEFAPSVEDWLEEHAVGYQKAALIRIFIPKTARAVALRNLNRMNVNHLSLFPDLYGASKYCNFQLTVDKY